MAVGPGVAAAGMTPAAPAVPKPAAITPNAPASGVGLYGAPKPAGPNAPRPTNPSPAPDAVHQFWQGLAHSPLSEPLPAGATPDASWLAFLRTMGYNTSTAYNTAAGAIDKVKRQLALSGATIGEQGQIARQGIDNNALARGVYSGGIRLRDLARQRAGQENQLASTENAGASQIGQVQSTLQQQLASLAQQRAEQILALQQRNEQQALLANPQLALVP